MKKYLNKKASLFFLALIIGVALVCVSMGDCREQAYPQMLLDADSAIMCGNYEMSDSLLKRFDKTVKPTSQSVAKYRQLLGMTRKYNSESIALKDLVLIDSLCDYYKDSKSYDKHARALLFRSQVVQLVGDYPSALRTCLDVLKQLEKRQDTGGVLYGWALQGLGNIYFTQNMLDECKGYYRQFYNLSVQRRDTLRIAIGAYLMGIVCTIENETDSIPYYYEKCIALSEHHQAASAVRGLSYNRLCDYYIQTEQFDKALAMMPRDEQNLANWAYWHYGQQHVDSAIHYFRQILGRNGSASDVEYLKILAQLEKDRGNDQESLRYYDLLLQAEDSVKKESQAEETRRTAAVHEYNALVEERNKASRHNTLLLILISAIGVLSVVMLIDGRVRKGKGEQETTANPGSDGPPAADGGEVSAMQDELFGSDIYRRLTSKNASVKRQLTDEEWQWLGEHVDAVYGNIGATMQSQYQLSETELHMVYLMRLGLSTTTMADVLCKSVSAVSHARNRLAKKIEKSDPDLFV